MTATKMLIGNISTSLISVVPWILPYLPVKRIQQVRQGFKNVESESKKILKQKQSDLKDSDVDNNGGGGGKDLMTLLRESFSFGLSSLLKGLKIKKLINEENFLVFLDHFFSFVFSC